MKGEKIKKYLEEIEMDELIELLEDTVDINKLDRNLERSLSKTKEGKKRRMKGSQRAREYVKNHIRWGLEELADLPLEDIGDKYIDYIIDGISKNQAKSVVSQMRSMGIDMKKDYVEISNNEGE